MPQPPTYHAKSPPRATANGAQGDVPTGPRHPAFCTVNFRGPYSPPKRVHICTPKRVVDSATIFLLDELPRPVRSCECNAFRCVELKKEGRARCGKFGGAILRVVCGRAQRCGDCYRRGAKS